MLLEKLKHHTDARGVVFEPLDADELQAQRNCHVVVTAPGAVRGNHYHKKQTELLAVTGPALVRYRRDDEVVDAVVPEGETHKFRFEPGVVHAVQNTGEDWNISVAFTTETHDPEAPDVYRDVLI